MKSFAECSSYKFLNESNRAKTYKTTGSALSDSTLVSGWYRLGGKAGNQMAESCVNTGLCGADEPGWLSGAQPSVSDGVVQRKVCFHRPDNCCGWSMYIDVRNCTGFYVYKLKPPPPSEYNLRYCGNGLPPAPGRNILFLLRHIDEKRRIEYMVCLLHEFTFSLCTKSYYYKTRQRLFLWKLI